MDASGEITDNEIIGGILGGRTDDFAILLERYRSYVFKTVSGYVPYDMVQDLAHEVFIEVYRSLPKFDCRTPFKKWLAGIAAHLCYDYWREHYRNREVPVSSLTDDHLEWAEGVLSARAQEAFAGAQSRKEAREILQWAMSDLSAEDRMVLILVHLEGASVKEAAEILGWSLINVKVRAHRTREKLRKRIATMLKEIG